MSQSEIVWLIDKQESDEMSFKNLNLEDLRNKLEASFKQLKPTCQDALKMSFGIGGEEKMSYEKIAKKFGVSTSAIGSRVNMGLHRLRRYENSDEIREYAYSDLNI